MPRRRGWTPDMYEKGILILLDRINFATTSEIADQLGMGYETTLRYLRKLNRRKKVSFKKRGSNRYWYLR